LRQGVLALPLVRVERGRPSGGGGWWGGWVSGGSAVSGWSVVAVTIECHGIT